MSAAPHNAASVLVAGALALFCAQTSTAALESYVRYDLLQSVSGSPAPYIDWVELGSFSWDAFRTVDRTRTVQPLPQFGALRLTHRLDGALTTLLEKTMTGNRLGEAKVEFYDRGLNYRPLVITVGNALVGEVGLLGDSSGSAPLADITLRYQTLAIAVNLPPGSARSGGTVRWNVATNVGGVGTAPTLTVPSTLALTEDTPAVLNFSVADDGTAASALLAAVTSSNTAVIASAGLVLGGSGANRTLTVTPVANATGSTFVTLYVTDGDGLTTSTAVSVSVAPVNDAPSCTVSAPAWLHPQQPVQFVVALADVDSPASSLNLTVQSSNPTLIPQESIRIEGTGSSRVVTVTPAQLGSAQLVFAVTDGSAGSSSTVPVSITTPSASAPSALTINAGSVPEGSGAGAVAGTLGAIDATQSGGHTFTLIDDVGGTFVLAGNVLSIANPALLDHEAHPVISPVVQARNSAGYTFSGPVNVLVSNVNEGPVITLSDLGTAVSGAPHPITAIAIADPDAGDVPVQLQLQVFHGRLIAGTALLNGGAVTGSGTSTLALQISLPAFHAALEAGGLLYLSDPGYQGGDALRVACSDGGATGSGGPLADEQIRSFLVEGDAYAQWRAARFSAEELAEPLLSGDDADYDGDTLPNLMEYVFGTEPKDSASGRRSISLFTTADAGSVYPSVAFTRSALTTAFSATVETSTNLQTWDGSPAAVTLLDFGELPDATEFRSYRSNVPLSTAPAQHFRIRVERVPTP